MGGEEAFAAFRDFDFNGNEGWKQYSLNLEIPPGKDQAAVLQRFKAKWYKREINPDFDVSLAGAAPPGKQGCATPTAQPSSTEPATASAHAAPPPTQPPEPAQPAADPSRSAASGRAAPSGRRQGAASWLGGRLGVQDALFALHTVLLVLGLGIAQPLSGLLAFRCWRWFLAASVLTQGIKVYQKRGLPRLRPFSLAALRDWAAPLTGTTDFQYLFLSLLFLQSRPLALAALPLWVLALYHFFAYAAAHFGGAALWQRYGVPVHSILSASQGQALVANAGAEIGVGFLLLLGLLTPARTVLLTLIYWKNFLPMRYHTPDAAAYHRQAWALINARAGPLLRAVPLLQTPIGFVRRQFEQPR